MTFTAYNVIFVCYPVTWLWWCLIY